MRCLRWSCESFEGGIYLRTLTDIFRGIALCFLTHEASKHLHKQALNQVFHAPVSLFFVRTPAETLTLLNCRRCLSLTQRSVDLVENIPPCLT